MLKTIVAGAIVALISTPAFATNPGNNGGGNGGCGVGQTTNGCAPGTGGAGGNATATAAQSQGQVQGQSQNSINANRNSNRNTNTAAGGTSNATGGNSNQSQGQQIDNSGAGSNSNNYQQSGIPVSSAVAPSFAIGGCQWAASGGIQFFGTGVSGGGAGMYEFCKGLMKARHFREDGNRDVAKSLECQDASIRAAYKEAGQPCAADVPRVAAAPIVPANNALPPNCVQQTVGGKSFITCK